MSRTLAAPFCLLTPAVAEAQGYGHMGEGGYGYGIGMMFAPVLWLLVLGLVVAGVVWFVRQHGEAGTRERASGARAELDLRFARGEIDAEDYASRRKLLDS